MNFFITRVDPPAVLKMATRRSQRIKKGLGAPGGESVGLGTHFDS